MLRAFFGAFGKRCHMHFCLLRQKMSRNDEGRISRAQSALEQLYQNFCANTREAGGLLLHHTRLILPEYESLSHLVMHALLSYFLSPLFLLKTITKREPCMSASDHHNRRSILSRVSDLASPEDQVNEKRIVRASGEAWRHLTVLCRCRCA
jgi:hypothetical protein